MTTLYNPAVPTGLLDLDEDYANIQKNFQQANTSFGLNHVAFSIAANNGKHKFVEMPVQSLPAGLTANEGTLYTKTANTVSELFYTPDNTNAEYQLTRTLNASTAIFSTNLAYPGAQAFEKGGWTFLPGGLLMQYGSVLPGESTSQTGTTKFPVSFTAAAYMVLTTPVVRATGQSGNQERVIAVKNTLTTNAQFEWSWDNNTSSYFGFNWIAIGK